MNAWCFLHDNKGANNVLLKKEIEKVLSVFFGGVAYWTLGPVLLVQVHTSHILLVFHNSVRTSYLNGILLVLSGDLTCSPWTAVAAENMDLQ